MSLTQVELDPPARLSHYWAALGALYAAQGYDDTGARGRIRHFSDGGGNWMRLALLPGGRALLFGWDRNGQTSCLLAERPRLLESDLLTGAPDWWAKTLYDHLEDLDHDWIGFIYGWEDNAWQRAAYSTDDGFRLFPKLDHAGTIDFIGNWISDSDAESPIFDADYRIHEAGTRSISTLVEAGPEVTAEQLAAVFPEDWDLQAGVAAAREFRMPND